MKNVVSGFFCHIRHTDLNERNLVSSFEAGYIAHASDETIGGNSRRAQQLKTVRPLFTKRFLV